MRFYIRNIGRIAKANLLLNGITIIVGDNNLGKTTSGRALYTFFNSLYRIDREVGFQRNVQIKKLIRRFFEKFRRPFSDYVVIHEAINRFLSEPENQGCEIRNYVSSHLMHRASPIEVDSLMMSIEEVKNWSNTAVRKQIIRDYFDSIFSGQTIAVDYASEGGSVSAEINGHNVSVDFSGDNVSYESDINIQHNAFFIDSPDLLNHWGRYQYAGGRNVMLGLSHSLRRAINSALFDDENPVNKAFENLLFTERYNKFINEVSEIMKGHFEFDSNGILRFNESLDGREEAPIFELDNVSEGIKAFGVIELMLKYRIFSDGDVLIFDEPEIHLHPEWQLKYARLLVKLQQEFNLTILITTHSSNFLMATQFFAKLEGREEVVNAYRIKQSEKNKRYSVVESAEHSGFDDAYISFIHAAQELDEIRKKAYENEG